MASCPARGLTSANQTSPRISCPVQMNQQKIPADQSSSRVSCPVQTTEEASQVDSTPHRVNCPVNKQPLMMEDGTVVLGECTNTQRWIKAHRIPRRLFLWVCTQIKMAIYVTPPAHEIWRRRDRSTGGIPEQSTCSITDTIRVL